MRKFVTLSEYAKVHNVGVSSVRYRIRTNQVPRKYLCLRKSPHNRSWIQYIREDYKIQRGRAKSDYNAREWTHTVFLPGGIKKVLQPHEYKISRWRKNVVQ